MKATRQATAFGTYTRYERGVGGFDPDIVNATLARLRALLADPSPLRSGYTGKQGCMCGCLGTYAEDHKRIKARLRAAIRKLEADEAEEICEAARHDGSADYLYLGYLPTEGWVDLYGRWAGPRGRCSCFYWIEEGGK